MEIVGSGRLVDGGVCLCVSFRLIREGSRDIGIGGPDVGWVSSPSSLQTSYLLGLSGWGLWCNDLRLMESDVLITYSFTLLFTEEQSVQRFRKPSCLCPS